MQFITTQTAQSDKSRDTKSRPSGRRFCTRLSGLYYRFKRQFFSRTTFARLVTAIFFLGLLTFVAVAISKPIISSVKFFIQISRSALPDQSGRTNLLLMGISGGSHDGADLTDTIIFVSIQPSTGIITLISLPRDLWVPSLKAKINSAFAYGKSRQSYLGGLDLAKSAVSEVLNQPVHFAAVADMSTISRLVDSLGGLDVHVDKSFTDPHYPIAGKENDPCSGDPLFKCRYETLVFTQGVHHMDGALVIKFVRSRYSSDPVEGTDFARSHRQQSVLSAFKLRVTPRDIIFHPQLYFKILKQLNSSIITDLTPNYYLAFVKLMLKVRNHNFKTVTLDESNYLYNPPPTLQYTNQWILLPKNNDPKIIFDYVASQLK
jgi:polyisoprenyl-teichoic acid--peptidoglycan teichoic acid transferase